MEQNISDVKRKRFFWGLALGWAPLAFCVFGLANAFRGISESKATGLGAVAGGFAEYLAIFGFVTAVTFEAAAVVLLVRGFTRQTLGQRLLSVVTILICSLWLLFVGVGVAIYLVFGHLQAAR